MREGRILALVALAIIVSVAGCSSVLSESGDDSVTPMDGQTPESTPTAMLTSEPTASSTPSPTATPTPTPVPDIVREHRDFGRAIGVELRKHSNIEEKWIRNTTGDKRATVIIARKPPQWTIKRTEMEVVREAVRLTKWRSSPDVEPGDSSGEDWHRPEEIRVIVQDQDGNVNTRLSVNPDLAVDYAEGNMSLEEFASRLNDTREIENNVSLDENSTSYYLSKAEWRQIRDEQVRLLNSRDWYIELDYSEIRVEKSEIYYHYSPPNSSQRVLQEQAFLRTYWEAVRNVSRQRLVHRFPERMRLYAEIPGDGDVETSIRTEYAFDFIRATGGDISDENILTNGAWNLYYPKKNITRYPDS